jgi:MFS family permease
VSEEQKTGESAEGQASSGPPNPAAPDTPPPSAPPPPPRSWGWPIAIGLLALAGILLALADIALESPWQNPLATALLGPAVVTPLPGRDAIPERGRIRYTDRFVLGNPIGRIERVSPVVALRAFLSNGAGLIFLALAALVLFPRRARVAVEKLEDRLGPAIALAAGVVTFLLALAAITLLGFTLIFLAVIPVVLLFAVAAALFGMACIALGLGRLLQRRLNLGNAHPLIAGLAGALIVFDLAVIPYVGILALAAVVLVGLGLAVVTRFGSESGWSFDDLSW